MLREGMTRLEAAQMWVNGFNAVPTQMIAKLMQADPDDWCEVKLDNCSTWPGHISLMEVECDGVLPMWGTMWSFGDSCDEHWLDDSDVAVRLPYLQEL